MIKLRFSPLLEYFALESDLTENLIIVPGEREKPLKRFFRYD